MKVLIYEDLGPLAYGMEMALTTSGHEVLRASNFYRAQDLWEAHRDSIDAVITDLNMSTEGLTDEEAEATRRGLLTGWVWLQCYVYKDKPEMQRRTIICSEYIDRFCEFVPAGEREGVRLVEKRATGNPPGEEVLSHLARWARGEL